MRLGDHVLARRVDFSHPGVGLVQDVGRQELDRERPRKVDAVGCRTHDAMRGDRYAKRLEQRSGLTLVQPLAGCRSEILVRTLALFRLVRPLARRAPVEVGIDGVRA